MNRFFDTAAKWLIMFVAGMMILLSLDVFELDASVWELIGAFFVHAAPGLAIVVITLALWKHHRVLGLAAFGFAIALIVLFGQLGGSEGFNWGLTILVAPLVVGGTILLWNSFHK